MVAVEATDLRSAIDALDRRHPGLKGRLLDETGQPRQFVNIYVNEEDVRLGQGLDSGLAADDEVSIIPAVAGGRAPAR